MLCKQQANNLQGGNSKMPNVGKRAKEGQCGIWAYAELKYLRNTLDNT